jgi:hypothetical protein
VGNRCVNHVTPLYPSKLALASLTGGGRSVGLDPHGLLRQGLLLFNINLLKHSGFFTYHQAPHSKILHGARFALSVLYGSHSEQAAVYAVYIVN